MDVPFSMLSPKIAFSVKKKARKHIVQTGAVIAGM